LVLAVLEEHLQQERKAVILYSILLHQLAAVLAAAMLITLLQGVLAVVVVKEHSQERLEHRDKAQVEGIQILAHHFFMGVAEEAVLRLLAAMEALRLTEA
jgi:hypothetical protein